MEKAVVLIVEDEALIRMGAVQMVEDAGFAAVEASNADLNYVKLDGNVGCMVNGAGLAIHLRAHGLRLDDDGVGRFAPYGRVRRELV